MTEHIASVVPSHLLAASLPAGGQARVLKHADTFGIFDAHGDITPGELGEEGLYHEGTRFLSALTLEMEQPRPLYLDSAIRPQNDLLTIALTNPDLVTSNGLRLPVATIHVALKKFLWCGVLYQQIVVTHYGRDRIHLALAWRFAADYADIFTSALRGDPSEDVTSTRLSRRIPSHWVTRAATTSDARHTFVSTHRRRPCRHRRRDTRSSSTHMRR